MNENESIHLIMNHNTTSGMSPYRLVNTAGNEIYLVNKYLDSLAARGLSKRTIRIYAYDLLCFWRWLILTRSDLKDITRSSLLEYIQHLRSNFSLAPVTINHRLVVVDCLYQYHFETCIPKNKLSNDQPVKLGAFRMGWIHPARKRRLSTRVKVPRKIIVPLTQQEVINFFNSLKSWRDIAITGFMLFCGLRSRETINLKLDDMKFSEYYTRILGKGDKERIVPLPKNLVKVIIRYLRLERPKTDSQYLFVVLKGPRRGYSLTTSAIRKIFRYHREISGIHKANAHRFRHTFGAYMTKAGISLVSLMKLMGHTDIQTTMQYVNLSAEDVKEEFDNAINKLNAGDMLNGSKTDI